MSEKKRLYKFRMKNIYLNLSKLVNRYIFNKVRSCTLTKKKIK